MAALVDPLVVGIDPSLTALGLDADGCPRIVAPPRASSPRTHDDDMRRLAHLRDVVVLACDSAALVVVEGYSYGSKGAGILNLAELGGVLRLALWEAGVRVAFVTPQQRAKYATGRGNAGKAEVVSEVTKRSGLSIRADGEADAWVLRQMGLARYWPQYAVEMPAAHREVLDKVDWPADPR